MGLWTAFKALGFIKQLGIGLAVVGIILGTVYTITKRIELGGVMKERAATASAGLEATEAANAARNNLNNRSPDESKSDCMRWARNPEDC